MLWAITERMLEFEEDSEKSKIAKFDAPGIEVYMTV